jgi:hypothetical protein
LRRKWKPPASPRPSGKKRATWATAIICPLDDPEEVLLVDSWTDQEAIDAHHASPMMEKLAALREKYDLHMTAERFVSEDLGTEGRFIRR